MNDAPAVIPERIAAAKARADEVGFAMSCEDRTGALLATLAASKPGGRMLEIGTGVGVGAAWLLAGMDPAARLTTIEIDPQVAAVASDLLDSDGRVDLVVADAADWLASYAGPPYDLAFVDWRVGKFERRVLLLDHLAIGGLYVGDDLLPQPTWPPDHQGRVDAFLGEIGAEPDLVVTLMRWASGLVVAARTAPA